MGPSARVRWTLAVALVGAAHFAFALDWGLSGGRSLAPDEVSPRRVAAAQEARFARGWHDYYPPVMFYATAAAGSATDALLGEPAPGGVAFRRHTLVARAISVAAAVATLLVLLALGRRLGLGGGAAAVAALAWAASPTVTYYAKTGNVESLYLLGLAVALALATRALDEGSAGALTGSAVALALAAATKDQGAVYGLCASLAVLACGAGGKRVPGGPRARLGVRGLAAAAASGLAVYLVLLGVPFNADGVRGHFESLRQVARLAPEFPATVAGKLAQAVQTAVNFEYLLGLPLLLLAGWGLVAVVRDGDRRRRHRLHLWTAGGYAAFMGLALPRAYDRFLLPVALSAVLLAGAGADDLLARFPSRQSLVGAALGAILVYSAARSVELDLRLRFDSRVTIGEWIARDGGSPRTTWVLGKHDWAPLAGRQVALGNPPYFERQLRRWAPRHLVVEAAWGPSRRWREALRAAGYVEARRDTGAIRARLSHPGRARTNLDKVSPELVVFRRAAAPGGSAERAAGGPS